VIFRSTFLVQTGRAAMPNTMTSEAAVTLDFTEMDVIVLTTCVHSEFSLELDL